MAQTRTEEAKPVRKGNGAGNGADHEAGKDQLLQFYRQMLLIRRFEERAGQLYGMGLIGGFCHLYIGQEAVAVGVQAVKTPGDQVITEGQLMVRPGGPVKVAPPTTQESSPSTSKPASGAPQPLPQGPAEVSKPKADASFKEPPLAPQKEDGPELP